MTQEETHPLVGKTVRWTHGTNRLDGPATHYDAEDHELFIVPEGLMHGHYWVPADECVELTSAVGDDLVDRVAAAWRPEFFAPADYASEAIFKDEDQRATYRQYLDDSVELKRVGARTAVRSVLEAAAGVV
jgi:hypothetical protein